MTNRKMMISMFLSEALPYVRRVGEEDPKMAMGLLRVFTEMAEVMETLDWSVESAQNVSKRIDPAFVELGLTPGHLLWFVAATVLAGPLDKESEAVLREHFATLAEHKADPDPPEHQVIH